MSEEKDDSVAQSDLLTDVEQKELEAVGKELAASKDLDKELDDAAIKNMEKDLKVNMEMVQAFDRPLTDDQKKMLADLMKMVTPEQRKSPMFHESVLERFLRARKFNLDAAYKMFSDMLAWRARHYVDWSLVNEPHSTKKMRQFYADCIHKFDKRGWPVYCCRLGEAYYYELSQRLTLDEFYTCHIHDMEILSAKSKEMAASMGHASGKQACLADLKGLGMHARYFMEYFKLAAEIDERNYPEMMGQTFVINAPGIFPFFWKITKPWLDPYTVAKMRVFGRGYEKELCDEMGADTVPAEFGGKCNCQGGCVTKLPKIDWKEFDENVRKEADRTFELDTVNVAAGKKHEITMQFSEKDLENVGTLNKPGDALRINWFFEVEARDIKFSIEFKPTKPKPEHVQPHYLERPRKYTAKIPMRGQVAVYEPGTVVITFDNSFSYFRSKTLKCGVRRELRKKK